MNGGMKNVQNIRKENNNVRMRALQIKSRASQDNFSLKRKAANKVC